MKLAEVQKHFDKGKYFVCAIPFLSRRELYALLITVGTLCISHYYVEVEAKLVLS